MPNHDAAPDAAVTTMMVGPQGGTVTATGGVTLSFAPAAVDEMTAVTVSVTPNQAPGFPGSSQVVQFEPSGAVFAKPVKIAIPVKAGVTNPALYWTSHDGGTYERLGGTVANGVLTAEISHFSSGFTAETTSATRTVELTAIDTYVLPDRIENIARDLSGTTIQVLVPTTTGYNVLSATGRADGTASIPNVPDGLYYVRAGSSGDWLGRDGSQIDVGEIRTGLNHSLATQTTPLTFDVTGMQPWQDGDGLVFYSILASAYYFLNFPDPDMTNAPVANDVALTGFGIDSRFTAPFDPYLIKNGDTATLLHTAQAQSSTNVPYAAVKETLTISNLNQVDGQTANVSGAFTTTNGTDGTLSVTYPVTQWDAYASQMYPAGSTVLLGLGRTTTHALSIEAHPSGLEKCCLSTTLGLLSFAVDAGADLASGTMTYLIPGDATYGLFGFASTAYRACRFAPGASQRACVQVAMRRFDTLAAMSSAPITPMLSPARNVRVDSVALTTDITGVGLTPLIEWDAPALGTPRFYRVVLREFPSTGGSVIVDSYQTPETKIRIPANTMQAGKVYAVTIVASATPNGSDSSPQRISFPEHVAVMLSSFFST